MRVLWLLNEIGCDFDVVTYRFDKTLRSEAFLRLSPAGRVPALEFEGRTIWESGAITQLLCEAFPEAGLGRPPGDPERADWLIWLHFAETIGQHLAILTQQHIMLREDAMRSPVIMRLEAKRLVNCCAVLDRHLAKIASATLLPSGFSAADIAVGYSVYVARFFMRLDQLPALAAWFAQMEKRPGFAKSLPQPDDSRLYTREFYPPWEDRP